MLWWPHIFLLKLIIINWWWFLTRSIKHLVFIIIRSWILFKRLIFDGILIDNQWLRRKIFWIRFKSLTCHHFISKLDLRCISALTMDTKISWLLKWSWLSYVSTSRFILKSFFHTHDCTIRIFLYTTINVMSWQSISLILRYIFFTHIHDVGHASASNWEFVTTSWIHSHRVHNLGSCTT